MSATTEADQWAKHTDGPEMRMDLDGQLFELMERLEADAGERGQAQALWPALAKGRAPGDDGIGDAWNASLIEEAVVWRIVALRMMKALGRGPLFSSKDEGPGAGKVTLHPAVDALAKSQERQRKVMKELMERLDAAAGGEVQSLPDMMAPILKKAEGVLDHALEPRRSTEGTRGKGTKKRRNRNLAGTS